MSIVDYFNSKTSTLNPYNRGFTFFVYGDLPMTIVRVAAEASNQFFDPFIQFLRGVAETANKFKLNMIGHKFSTFADQVASEALGLSDVKMLGRQFSALADLFTILILYFIVARLYNHRVALLATLFSALTVMQIQQSHFFTTDLFVNPFAFLAIWFAVEIMLHQSETGKVQIDESQVSNTQYVIRIISEPLFLLSLGFGVAYGMALA